jgi:hypothetical protein
VSFGPHAASSASAEPASRIRLQTAMSVFLPSTYFARGLRAALLPAMLVFRMRLSRHNPAARRGRLQAGIADVLPVRLREIRLRSIDGRFDANQPIRQIASIFGTSGKFTERDALTTPPSSRLPCHVKAGQSVICVRRLARHSPARGTEMSGRSCGWPVLRQVPLPRSPSSGRTSQTGRAGALQAGASA